MPGYPRPSHVEAVPLADLAVTSGARVVTGAVIGVLITGVTHDSTQVQPGDLYVAVRGSTRHGAQFADRAVADGAVAVLTDEEGASLIAGEVPVLVVDDPRAALGPLSARIYGDPSARMRVIGLTGTAGKTSTSYLVESGLAAAGHVTCLVGTVETRIAGQRIDSVRTTPEATDLHALLATAAELGASAAVMEVSSHALVYGRVGGVTFDVGGYTNFGQDHLDFHGSPEEYFAAKARLFDGRCRVEVLNADDPALLPLRKPATVTYSAAGDPTATWHARGVTREGFAQTFTAVHHDIGEVPVRVALPGRHNVANALLALACLVEAGVDPKVAAQGISACRGVPGRLELVDAVGPVLGVVDYAHKPDAIVAALAALREVVAAPGRLICVLGAGGDRDRGKRPVMGSVAAAGADVVVVTDDNPRSEDPAAIRAAVLEGARASADAQVIEVPGRREAIAEAVRLARSGDVIAVLGKGHERGQEVAGVVSPFDDRVELAAALNRRFGGSEAAAAGAGSAPKVASA